jgi:hypothetical protein
VVAEELHFGRRTAARLHLTESPLSHPIQTKYPPICAVTAASAAFRRGKHNERYRASCFRHAAPPAPVAEPAPCLPGKPCIAAGPFHDPEDFSG